jgi:hypothetical protein
MQSKLLPAVVPVLGLTLLGVFAALYAVDHPLYDAIITAMGIVPFRYPFLDWEYIANVAACWKRGIDVYVENPCDVLGRTHAYSPLWLRATFVPTGPLWRNIIGTGLDVSFFLSLFLLFKPANWKEVAIFALACTAPMVVFALERANVDVLLFLMIVAAGLLSTGPIGSRILSYAILLFAGLLKFYPLAALVTALRERPRTFFSIALVCIVVFLAFLYDFRDELAAMSRNIPRGSAGSDRFGAPNLLNGFAVALQRFAPNIAHSAWMEPIRLGLIAALLAATLTQALLLYRQAGLARAFSGIAARDRAFLTLGAALIAGCFFAGQSIEYRGIHLTFVVAGLLALRRAASEGPIRTQLGAIILIVVLLMWEGVARHALDPDGTLSGTGFQVFWLIRELLWWYLAASLVGVLAIFAAQSDLMPRRWKPG